MTNSPANKKSGIALFNISLIIISLFLLADSLFYGYQITHPAPPQEPKIIDFFNFYEQQVMSGELPSSQLYKSAIDSYKQAFKRYLYQRAHPLKPEIPRPLLFILVLQFILFLLAFHLPPIRQQPFTYLLWFVVFLSMHILEISRFRLH